MGTVVSKALLEKETNTIVVANRTYDKARQLAQELDGEAIKFDEMNNELVNIDIVISSTGAPHSIISKERIAFLPEEHLHDMIMLDLANPHDIENDVQELGVKVYNLDDLRYVTDKNKERRNKEAIKAEAIIEDETLLLKESLKQMEITPILSSLNIEAEKIRKQELDKTLHMLDLDKKSSKKVDYLTRSITDKLLYNIINNLKEAAANNDKDTIRNAKKILLEYN